MRRHFLRFNPPADAENLCPWTMLPAWVQATNWILAASGIYSRVIANSAKTAADFGRLATTFRAAFVPHRSRFRAQDQ